MKRLMTILGVAALSASVLAPAVMAQDRAKLDERLNHAQAVLQQVMATPDKAIPQSILAGAQCVVVIPDLVKGAFVIGGQYGQGVATCRTGHGWSAPIFVRLGGASFGFQLGGQSTDLVLVAMNQAGLQHALASKVKLGADAAAAAGPVGRTAQAATDVSMHAEFLTYSRSRGLFAGVDLSGDTLQQNGDDTHAFYGRDVNYNSILHGDVATPAAARGFVGTVAHYFVSSKMAQ